MSGAPQEPPAVTMDTSMIEPYEQFRPLMLAIAYRMLGSASEAEDIVQEAFLRYHRELAKGTEVQSTKAYLSAITTRLSIDHLRSARVRREQYVGTWLPEPLITEEEAGIGAALPSETADSLSMAFLVLLESLSPVERAVFLLREVFDYGYEDIAAIVGKTEDNCRQIAVRARRHVEDKRPRFEASRARREELAQRFFDAILAQDEAGLVELLAADVVVYADGGGAGVAFPRPVAGRDKVARLFRGPAAQGARVEITGFLTVSINGQPGAVLLGPGGRAAVVVTLDIADDQIQTVRAITNPDKLRHLGSFEVG